MNKMASYKMSYTTLELTFHWSCWSDSFFSCFVMDTPTAQSILPEVISHLPKCHWWPLLPNDQSPTTIANVFGRPQSEIEALLVTAGVCKHNKRWNKVTLHKDGWELFWNTLNEDTKPGDCFGSRYVAIGEPTFQIAAIKWGIPSKLYCHQK